MRGVRGHLGRCRRTQAGVGGSEQVGYRGAQVGIGALGQLGCRYLGSYGSTGQVRYSAPGQVRHRTGKIKTGKGIWGHWDR